jgi:hypothetical protein
LHWLKYQMTLLSYLVMSLVMIGTDPAIPDQSRKQMWFVSLVIILWCCTQFGIE